MPNCSAGVLEVPYHIENPVILIGRSGIESIFDKTDVLLEVANGNAEWLDAKKMRVQWASGKIERRSVNRAKLLNPKSPDFPSLHDLSAKMSPPNPKGGNGSYFQSADIAYYRLLDALVVVKRGRRAEMVLGFWDFNKTHRAFLSHVRQRLDRMHARPKRRDV